MFSLSAVVLGMVVEVASSVTLENIVRFLMIQLLVSCIVLEEIH